MDKTKGLRPGKQGPLGAGLVERGSSETLALGVAVHAGLGPTLDAWRQSLPRARPLVPQAETPGLQVALWVVADSQPCPS